MDTIISLSCKEIDDEDLQQLTLELCQELNSSVSEAKIPESIPEPGLKGEPVTIGTILITVIPVAGSLLGVLKTYLERRKTLELTLKRKGQEFTLKAENLDDKQLQQTQKLIKEFFEL